MIPFWQFYSIGFHDNRKTDEYQKGIRTILSIQYEKSKCTLLTDDYAWKAPVRSYKVKCGWLLINGIILSGWIRRTGYERYDCDDDSCC